MMLKILFQNIFFPYGKRSLLSYFDIEIKFIKRKTNFVYDIFNL